MARLTSTSSCFKGIVVFSALAGAIHAADSNPADSVAALKQMTVDQLMDIEVTSVSKQPELLLDAPAAIQVVTGKDITLFGASSIPEALQLADNLDVAQKGSHDWAISARGFNTDLANKLLVLMDGRTLYSPLFSGVFWDVQDYLMEDVDRIEVIAGPGGTLWGENAVNGVINITTKSAQDTQGLYVEAGGGAELEGFAAARYGGVLAPGVYFRVYGQYFDRGDEAFADGSRAMDSWKMDQAGFRMDAGTSSSNKLTLQGDYYAGDEDEDTGRTAKVIGENLLGRWTHTGPDDSSMSLQLYYDHTYLADPVPKLAICAFTLAQAGTLTDRLGTYDLDFQDHLRAGGRNSLVWGVGYRYTHDELADAPSLGFSPTILNQSLFSAFAQDDVTLEDNLFLTVGSKVEHNDYTGVEVEPNIRLRWDLSPRQMLWASVSRAVRAPSRVDRNESEPASPSPLILIEGSADFTSETVIAYELGYRAKIGTKADVSLSTFYNVYDDVRSTSTTPVTVLPFHFANDLYGDTYGLELSGSYQVLDWWQLRGGYDLLEEHISVKPGQIDINDALNETSDPEHQFSVSSLMNLPHELSLTSRLRWVDVLHNNNGAAVGTVPAYFELNARFAWQCSKACELSIVGQNLLHAHHPEYGFPGPTREEIERSVYAKAAWNF